MEIRFEMINTTMLWVANIGLIQNYIFIYLISLHLKYSFLSKKYLEYS